MQLIFAGPVGGARAPAELPPAAGKPKSYDAWWEDFAAWLFRTQKLDLLTCPRLKAFSRPGETEGDFRARLHHSGREQRDETLEQLRKKYALKKAALDPRPRHDRRARRAGRVLKERQGVGRAQETLEALQQQLADLDEAFKADAEKLGPSGDALAEPLETLSVRPSKQNVTVKLVALTWIPWWQDGAGQSRPAWQ